MVAEATGDRLQLQIFESERLAEEERQRELKQLLESVLALLQARGLEIDAATREMVLSCDDTTQAEAWLVRAATAETVEQVFTTPSAGH
jgi:hypothetical protein